MLFFFLFFLLFSCNSAKAESRIFESEGFNGAVSCGHPLAAEAALNVLKEGGNAVDAAVTAAFVLGVVDFTNSGIGGEGFALICDSTGRVLAIDGSTKRPAAKISNEYDCSASLPAIPEMLLKMQKFFGSKSANEVMQPAVKLCENGFEVTPYLASVIADRIEKIKDKRALALITNEGKAIEAGFILKQPVLGKTLKQLSEDMGLSFYYGDEAARTLTDLASKGSLYSKYDFMKYKSQLVKPIKLSFKDFEIYGHPLPSCSVATIKLAMKLIETKRPLLYWNFNDIVQQAKICREVLNEKYYILSQFYGKTMDFIAYTPLNQISEDKDANDSNTTHLCVWDKDNMVVSMTLTLGNHFGTGELAPGGFFYANSLRTFSDSVVRYTSDYPAYAGSVTSKSPIFVKKQGEPWLALGGAGADRIITNTAFVLARMLKGFNLSDSVNVPRFFLDYNGRLYFESSEELRTLSVLSSQTPMTGKFIAMPYLHDFFGLISGINRPALDKPIKAVGDRHRDGTCTAY